MGEQLRYAIGARRMAGGVLVLERGIRRPEDLRGRRLEDPAGRQVAAGEVEDVQRAERIDDARCDRLLDGIAGPRKRSEIVDFVDFDAVNLVCLYGCVDDDCYDVIFFVTY